VQMRRIKDPNEGKEIVAGEKQQQVRQLRQTEGTVPGQAKPGHTCQYKPMSVYSPPCWSFLRRSPRSDLPPRHNPNFSLLHILYVLSLPHTRVCCPLDRRGTSSSGSKAPDMSKQQGYQESQFETLEKASK
jgi:hypothetical protein